MQEKKNLQKMKKKKFERERDRPFFCMEKICIEWERVKNL